MEKIKMNYAVCGIAKMKSMSMFVKTIGINQYGKKRINRL